MFEFIKADIKKFAIYHTLYTASNIFDRYDWNERIDDAIDCISNTSVYFVHDKSEIVGGFTLKENCVNYPFIVPPFKDRKMFWGVTLDYAIKTSGCGDIFLNEIPETDATVLEQSFFATRKWSKQKMIRPTALCTPALTTDFYFSELMDANIKEIIRVIYDADANGHASTVWQPDINDIETTVQRRVELFTQTHSLHMSNVVRNKISNEIVGVCIVGVYPDAQAYSTKNFATIHQISVKPEYQRKGIAKAMLLKSISDANKISPAITLGVLEDNPAKELYNKIGFKAGALYSGLHYNIMAVKQ
ncbi:MAG: GNAT family N-acetyltransferase [Defluviitaleaceae bacterium]|nr:GNAT family N-acetyltransferase [Defluviitaleaceae bacterium]MCL2274965.1 GNAT family N-acetyltransferase [Defluviitaleaceae bacterium]